MSMDLRWALLTSLTVHIGLLLGLNWVSPVFKERVFQNETLEIILVNARSSTAKKIKQPQALAQTNLEGGGDLERSRARSIMAQSRLKQSGNGNGSIQQQLTAMEQEQTLLLSQVRKMLADMPKMQTQTSRAQMQQQQRQLEKMLAEIEQRMSDQNARPRKRFIGPNTREVSYAQYYRQVKSKIEIYGTKHFPVFENQRLYGNLVLLINIDANGKVLSIEVVRSSGQAELDLRARAIAAQAGPFGSFSKVMRREADQLAFFSRFQFESDGSVRADWSAQ